MGKRLAATAARNSTKKKATEGAHPRTIKELTTPVEDEETGTSDEIMESEELAVPLEMEHKAVETDRCEDRTDLKGITKTGFGDGDPIYCGDKKKVSITSDEDEGKEGREGRIGINTEETGVDERGGGE